MNLRSLAIGLVALGAAFVAAPRRADAIPIFAHTYGLTCQKCHSVVPHLNDFGAAFEENGFRLPDDVRGGKAVPISTKINLIYTSQPDPGLPKAVVDEIELLTGGKIGTRASYFAESYVIDGGRHGNLRDAWIRYRFTGEDARVPVSMTAGQFTLPLPVDPETFRETAQHYAVFDQTVGDNPFNFFRAKTGVMLGAGERGHGLSVALAALNGHDPQNGLPTIGTDTMATLHQALGPFEAAVYRYAGKRQDGAFVDRFTRTGYGLSFARGRWTSQSVIQTGRDSSFDGSGTPFASSGGFSQLRYDFNRKFFGLVRYDGTNDTEGFARSMTVLLGYRVARNTRFTVEDVITHVPAAKHTLNAQYLIGY